MLFVFSELEKHAQQASRLASMLGISMGESAAWGKWVTRCQRGSRGDGAQTRELTPLRVCSSGQTLLTQPCTEAPQIKNSLCKHGLRSLRSLGSPVILVEGDSTCFQTDWQCQSSRKLIEVISIGFLRTFNNLMCPHDSLGGAPFVASPSYLSTK